MFINEIKIYQKNGPIFYESGGASIHTTAQLEKGLIGPFLKHTAL